MTAKNEVSEMSVEQRVHKIKECADDALAMDNWDQDYFISALVSIRNLCEMTTQSNPEPASEGRKCLGYPACDGNLPGEPHEPECPKYEPEAAQPQPSTEELARRIAEKCAEVVTSSYPQHIRAGALAEWVVKFERIAVASMEGTWKKS